MEKNRSYFKNLLADNALDTFFPELFELLSAHQERFHDAKSAGKYDELVLLSGKLNSARQNYRTGNTTTDELNTELSRVNLALLELLNDLPDKFFLDLEISAEAGKPAQPGEQRRISLPQGLRNGFFWMFSVVLLMVTLGSMVQKNWLTVCFLSVATLLCLPISFDFLSEKLRIALSSAIRLLIILVLMSVGLSYASVKNNATEPQKLDKPLPGEQG